MELLLQLLSVLFDFIFISLDESTPKKRIVSFTLSTLFTVVLMLVFHELRMESGLSNGIGVYAFFLIQVFFLAIYGFIALRFIQSFRK